jgi:hypothetical protein
MTCELVQDRVDDRYRLIRVLSEAGSGRIWLAEDELLWRRVAIQELAGGVPLKEALTRLHVVKVFNAVDWDGRTWIVMEAAIGVARPLGPRIAAPRANGPGWRGRAKVPAPTSRNGFDR